MRSVRFPTRAWLISPLFLLCTGCPPPGTGNGGTTPPVPASIAVAPICVLLATTSMANPDSFAGLIAERTDDASKPLGFVKFHRLSEPIGNSAVGFKPSIFALNESWLHHPVSPVVFRAMAHPAKRPQFNDFNGTAWSIFAQENTGKWTRAAVVMSANRKDDQDDAAGGARAVPQFMPVGNANPQMFACAGTRNEDNTGRTTSLEEIKLDPASHKPTADFIQDVVWGDDRFVPNTPGPLIGPANPPTPTVHSPGNHVPNGMVKCAMTQSEDDVSTRELHMLTIDNGVLYHAMASNWGETTDGGGFKFDRFRTVSQWSEVSQALGGNFGYVTSAIIVAKPRMISVFFVAHNNNLYQLWHAVRYSDNGGSWRNPVDDVLALSNGSHTGLAQQFDVAAGWCPISGEEAADAPPQEKDELLYVIYFPDRTMTGGRIVSARRNWTNGVPGNYSPLNGMDTLLAKITDTTRNARLESLSITTRPFPDNAKPPEPPP